VEITVCSFSPRPKWQIVLFSTINRYTRCKQYLLGKKMDDLLTVEEIRWGKTKVIDEFTEEHIKY
jgi:hypothetical protein